VVSPDIAAKVFTSSSDARPANAWFAHAYESALRKNGFLARAAETARYQLNADVSSLTITPLATGTHHNSVVILRLIEITTGRQVWSEVRTTDFDIRRGVRFGKIGGVIGLAVAGALTGQNPGVTNALIGNARAPAQRPFDTRIDVYEGIMRGFQQMALGSMASLALGANAAEGVSSTHLNVALATPAHALGNGTGLDSSAAPAPPPLASEARLAISKRREVPVVSPGGLVDVPFETQ
jgi:hypothetical protein